MKKRGILQQPFYYIFAIIVLTFIFLFGYQQITKLKSLEEQAKFITFKSDFGEAIENIYYKNPDSIIIYSQNSRNKPLTLPNDSAKIFFKKSNEQTLISSDSKYFISFYLDSIDLKEGTNLKLENNEYCAKLKNSQFSFTLENKIQDGKTIIEIR